MYDASTFIMDFFFSEANYKMHSMCKIITNNKITTPNFRLRLHQISIFHITTYAQDEFKSQPYYYSVQRLWQIFQTIHHKKRKVAE